MMFAMYFIVASVLGQLTARVRAQQEAERQREARATALYLLAAELNGSTSLDLMVKKLVRQMEIAFDAAIAFFCRIPGTCLPRTRPARFQPEPAEQPFPIGSLLMAARRAGSRIICPRRGRSTSRWRPAAG